MLGEKMYPYFEDYLASIAAGRRIEVEDVRAIRCVLAEEVAVDRRVIERLIGLDRSARGCAEWRDFLAEMVADYAIWVEGPLGEVSAETGTWLIEVLSGTSGEPAPSAASIVHAITAEAEVMDSALTLFALSAPGGQARKLAAPRFGESASGYLM